MKLIAASLAGIILLSFCTKVKLVDASSQKWIAGRFESGYGTDYLITIKARAGSDKLVFDKLWIGDDYYEVNALRNLAKRSDLAFEKGDTVFIRAGEKYLPDENGKMVQQKGKTLEPPTEFTGAALLGYTFKSRRKYLEIKEFRVLEKIIYP